jgi:hypothetical protein
VWSSGGLPVAVRLRFPAPIDLQRTIISVAAEADALAWITEDGASAWIVRADGAKFASSGLSVRIARPSSPSPEITAITRAGGSGDDEVVVRIEGAS